MGDKITKISERWLLIENDAVKGVISISHIDAIYSAEKRNASTFAANLAKSRDATELFLSGAQSPMRLDIPFADVLNIITGPPKDIDTTAEGGA